ncbi:MAG: hypothetical protein KKC55_15765 [Gammaproteobacteria bacterium]|nr:hypothetical protein [Gammaproteobacteria bacterium]
MTSNIVLSKTIAGTSYQVTIFTTRVEENLTKALTVFTPPTSTANQDKDPEASDFEPTTYIIDLLMKWEYRITVDGYIADETLPAAAPDTYSSGDAPGTQTAQTKRTNLRKIFTAGGTFSLVYDGVTYTMDMDKLSITDDSADEGTATKYNVKFTAVQGQNMPARS